MPSTSLAIFPSAARDHKMGPYREHFFIKFTYSVESVISVDWFLIK